MFVDDEYRDQVRKTIIDGLARAELAMNLSDYLTARHILAVTTELIAFLEKN